MPELLPGQTIRAIARQLMPEFIRLGMSRRVVQRQLQELYGQAYRWDTLRRDYNEFMGLQYYKNYWNKLKPQDAPKRFMFIEQDLPRSARYYTRFNVTFEDILTGQEIQRNVSFYSNESRTIEQWEEMLADLYGTTECGVDKRFLRLENPQFYHNKGLDY